jgi:hypothetical protein
MGLLSEDIPINLLVVLLVCEITFYKGLTFSL